MSEIHLRLVTSETQDLDKPVVLGLLNAPRFVGIMISSRFLVQVPGRGWSEWLDMFSRGPFLRTQRVFQSILDCKCVLSKV